MKLIIEAFSYSYGNKIPKNQAESYDGDVLKFKFSTRIESISR